LRAAREELPDVALYYTISGLSKTVKATSPKMSVLRDAIVNSGFRVSPTHCNCEGVKTDAPPEVRSHSLVSWGRLADTFLMLHLDITDMLMWIVCTWGKEL
jgi:tRNA (guanine26-N2/guanine27-N2)-dimethyltransferase